MRALKFVVLVLALTGWAGLLQAQVPPAKDGQTPPGTGQTAPAEAPKQPPAPPQPAAPPAPPVLEVDAAIKSLVARMDAAEKAVTAAKDRDDELGRLRGEVEGILYESTQIAENLRPGLADVKSQIERLGPLPKPDQPPEAAPVQAERARLNALASAIDGAIKTTELTWVRARQLIERITDMRHALFAQSLFQRLPSPFSVQLWRDVWNDWGSVFNTFSYIGASWLELAAPKSATILGLLILTVVLYLALRHTFERFTAERRMVRATQPTFFERAAAVTWYAPLRAIAPIFAALLLYVGLDALDILHFWADRVAWAVIKSVLIFSSIAAIIGAVTAPGESSWRLVPLADKSATQIAGLLQGIAAVYAIDLALAEISRWLALPLNVNVVETIAANLSVASLLVCLLLTPFAQAEPTTQRLSRHYPIWLKGPIWLVVLAILAATFMGYVALGRFIGHQLVLTGVVVVVSGLLYLAIRAFTRDPMEAGMPVGDILETKFGLDAPRRKTLARLTELALTLLLVMLAVPFILLQWGFAGADIRDWFKSIFFGFEIGQFRISLAKILLGILLFVALVLVTRLFQRWLKDLMLHSAHLDPGITHSIDTVVGYAGTAIAALIAISYAGFDITNLAIVAGALSVGIGFGLQSIVNNFVSGLILLVERPVKVGDWIVVGGDEGYVRRISVRSTEIETFDRSSVVIPNSELISGRVKNWTLRDAVGRIRITVSVRYDMDPGKARALLLKLASDNKGVLQYPAPYVTFDSFSGDSAMLSLNIFVADVNRGGGVKSELSFAILKVLPEAGVSLSPGLATPAAATGDAPEGAVCLRLPIGIGYEADPEKVRAVMIEVAGAHGDVLKSPPPQVEFEAFANDAATLVLNVSVADAGKVGSTRTDLGIAIWKGLREAGLGNPMPQHSVKLTDLEPFRRALFQAMEERLKKQAGDGAMTGEAKG